jgi:hypothetical protein
MEKPNKQFMKTISVLNSIPYPPTFPEKQKQIHQFLIKKLETGMDNPCSDRMKKIYLQFLDHINYDELTKLVSKEFYNIEVMKTMSCFIHSVLDSEQDYIDYLTRPNVLKFKDKTNLLVFFTAFLTGKERILAFKYDNEDTLEEGMVGLLGVNSLRAIIPTFAWIYGFTKCNLPVFTKSGNKYEIVTACQQKVGYGKKDYIGMISEYVNGPTLIDYIRTPQSVNVKESGLKELLSALLTILYSLKYANEKMKYVHWDLHQNNVLMRELNVNNAYIYLPDENEYLWVGSHLATIIDYGLSSFEYEGKNISRYAYPQYGINPELSTSPLNDFFKLINSLYSITFNDYLKNKTNRFAMEKFKVVLKIYGYFLGTNDSNEMAEVNEAANKTFSIFPNAPNYTISDFVKNIGSNVTLDDIIKMIKNWTENYHLNLFTQNKPTTVLSCDTGACLDEFMIEKVIMSREQPLSLQEAVLLSSRLKNGNPKDQKYQKEKNILDNFLIDYVDKIYNIVQSYLVQQPNVSVDMIYLFNDLRLMEHQLKVLEIIMKDSDNKELLVRIQKQKEVIYKLVNEIYDHVEKSLKDKASDYNQTTYKPMSVENSSYLLLQNAFEDLAIKAKNAPKKEEKVRQEQKQEQKQGQKQGQKQEELFLYPESPKKGKISKGEKKQEELKIEEISEVPIPKSQPSTKQPGKSRSHISSIVIPVPVQGPVSSRMSTRSSTRSQGEMPSSIPLPPKQANIPTLGSSLPVESSSKNLFVIQLKKYEQLLNGQKGVFIKSNLRKGKVQNMYNFVLENKDLVNADPLLKSDIKKKMEWIKNLDSNYEEMIDQYMKQLNL